MSDTQGAQDETGSGGLANDMPGIGNAPPSPRMVPSGLGGIANYARQALGIGAPAPQGAQPGVSPFAAPGRSQLPPPSAGGPQPGPRWQGTTASLALPKGATQPPAKFTPFIGSLPTSNWRQWGQPEEYPNLPQSFELPGIAQGLSQFFGKQGQGGGGLIQALALTQGKYAGEFLKAFQQGEEFKAKMAREKWLQHSLELQDQLEQRHTLYADHIRMYMEKADYDQSKLGNISISGVGLRDQLHRDAMQTGDEDIIRMIEDGSSFQKIMDYQNYRDSKLKDLQKVNTKAQEQADEDAKTRQELGIPGSGQTTSPNDPFARPTEAQPSPASGSPQPSPAPSGGAAPTMVASNDPNSPFANPNQPQPDPNAARPDPTTGLLPYQEDARDVYKGANINQYPKAGRTAISDEAARVGSQVNQVKSGFTAGQIKPADIPAALDKIMPGMGNDYTNTLNGAPIPAGVQGRSPYWQSIRSLIPGFDPITQQATIKDFATSGKAGTRLSAGARMGPAAVTVLEAAKKIPEGEPIPYYMADALIAGKWTGDPKYQGLFNALNTYIQDAQALQSPTGRFFVTEVESLKRNLQTTTGLRAVRTFLQQDAENSTELADQLVREYQAGSRRFDQLPTSYDKQNFDILRAVRKIDPDHGFAGVSDLPAPLQGLGLGADAGAGGGGGGFKLPPGVTITPLP